MVFLVQKLIYKTNISFNFVPGSFFEQNHLLNLIIFGTKIYMHEPDAAQNQIIIFFKFDCQKTLP